MKILVDMNLAPSWCELLCQAGWEAVHWSEVGRGNAPDTEIIVWARGHGYLVLTHDLDFGTALALTGANGPSVVQVRSQDVMPSHLGGIVVAALRQSEGALEQGALVVVDEKRARVRLLPLGR